MYGEVDVASGEWTTGVFAAIWAKCNNRNNAYTTWIVADGPVDAIWIEDLNTVLDDNRLLTLANGDRIPMTDNVVVKEKEVLELIDKIRITVVNNAENIKSQYNIDNQLMINDEEEDLDSHDIKLQNTSTSEKLKKYENDIKQGADQYADEILSELQLIISKMQKDLTKFDRNISLGRQEIDKPE